MLQVLGTLIFCVFGAILHDLWNYWGSALCSGGAGESHGPAITTIVFGCPPGLYVRAADIQHYLDRRRPGSNKHGTPRREDDTVVLLSGLYQDDHDELTAGPPVPSADGEESATTGYAEGYTTGEPIAAIVLSTAKKSADYAQFCGATGEVRPGHTDLVKHYKSQGFVDVRGGGRSSYRSTISDVIGGSIARLFLRQHFGTAILSSICQVGLLQAERSLAGRCRAARAMSGRPIHAGGGMDELERAWRRPKSTPWTSTLPGPRPADQADAIDGDSIGAAVEIVAVNVPPLRGRPLYQSLKLRLMGSLGGLNAVQGVEIGAGFAGGGAAGQPEQRPDPPQRLPEQQPRRPDRRHHHRHAPGLPRGLQTDLHYRQAPGVRAEKPGRDRVPLQKGRHDPCVGVRAGVTLESRVAIELLNAVLMHQPRVFTARTFASFPRPWRSASVSS